MKKILPLLVFSLLSLLATAQVSKTINVTTAGTLSTLLSSTELSTVTNLTVSGNIDIRDVLTMRDNMPLLAVLDMGAVSINAYYSNTANVMPQNSFYNGNAGKTTLKTITLPTSITSIGSSAFSNCTGLTGSLTIPNLVTSIGSYAFCNCTGLTGSLTIPNLVTSIGSYAFYKCSGFTGSLSLPNLITTIGMSAFESCSGFAGSLSLPNSVTTIGSSAFERCSGLTGNLTIPNSVTTIESYAFLQCTNFTGSLTLGSGLTSIANHAFEGCAGFKIIKGLNATPPTVGGTFTFSGVSPAVVYVPANAGAAYKAASGWSGYNIAAEKRLVIDVPTPGGMAAAIIVGSFGPLNSITHLTVTGNLNSVDIDQMKINMTALTSIDLSGATIASNALPANAFQSRTSLTSVILPSNILIIGDYAFDGCVSLNGDLPLPASVTSLGAYAFQNCKSLTGTLKIPSGVTVINIYTFSNCIGISDNLTLASTVTSIGSYAFNGCKSLTGTLIIPSNITAINSYTFAGCTGFTGSITLANSITTLGINAFQNCTGFTGTLTLSNTLTAVSASTFQGCSQLTGKIEVPNSVTSIGASAFQGCAKITEFSIGKILASIGDNALNGCTSLAKISVPRSTPPTIYTNTFGGVNKESCILEVPTGSSLSYQTAQFWSQFIFVNEKNFNTSIDFPTFKNNIKVYSIASKIIIEGTSEGELVSLFTINGKQIQTQKSVGERMVIPVQCDGVYLVKTAGRTFKVIL